MHAKRFSRCHPTHFPLAFYPPLPDRSRRQQGLGGNREERGLPTVCRDAEGVLCGVECSTLDITAAELHAKTFARYTQQIVETVGCQPAWESGRDMMRPCLFVTKRINRRRFPVARTCRLSNLKETRVAASHRQLPLGAVARGDVMAILLEKQPGFRRRGVSDTPGPQPDCSVSLVGCRPR